MYSTGLMLAGAVTIGALAMIYFIPSMVAYYRDHQSLTGIILLNIFLGWTFLGWVGALIWSVSPKRQAPTIIYQTPLIVPNQPPTKECVFCHGEVLVTASKCEHCGEDLS